MTFIHEAVIESPWVYAGTKGIKKAWKSVTIFADNNTTYNRIYLDYKLDDEGDSWTVGSAVISPNPTEEEDFSTTTRVGYRIKYRLRYSQLDPDGNICRIRAIVVNCYGIAPIKHGDSWMAKIAERGYSTAAAWQDLGGLGFRGSQKRVECFPTLVIPQWSVAGERSKSEPSSG